MRKYQGQFHLRPVRHVAAIVAWVAIGIATDATADAQPAPPTLRYEVFAVHPHDVNAFTQGLAVLDGKLLESTGRYGRSRLRLVDPATGRVLRERALDARLFGEGAAAADGRVVQLTWRAGLALLYDAATLEPSGVFRYAGEGWGLAFDGRHFVMSDGSAVLTERDRATFAERRRVTVRAGGRPVPRLNELEFADGRLYANVWQTDRIAVIEPATGSVRAWLDLSGLRERFDPPAGWNPAEDVLNGIAWDPERRRFYVTGKRWPALFEIGIRDAPPAAPP